ncbi:hypothetical protein FJU30_17060 [Affinibrenneria salicis]|uniref:Uncharacterized protein n=1 Tax=Affinibrenneria salicis TaxID=2590031 RepID=A0A5J5FWD9_9GAMM|nr:hypothetical protein [Affinibrenneria salicis]KAA8998125.1 hypothetical protein FJU30_17060 [Affinibrenneria salicis]
MSLPEASGNPDVTFTDLPASVAEARQQTQQAQTRLNERNTRVTNVFMIVQGLFCGYFLVKWLWQGHYIGGPIYAVLLWCVTWLAYLPLQWLSGSQRRDLDQARNNETAALLEASKAFMDSLNLGPYRWILRGRRVLGVFPASNSLYLLAPESGQRHALIDARRVVKQVTVAEQSQTQETTETSTTHGRRRVWAFNNHVGVVGKGKSRSTSTTTVTTTHHFTLNIQLQAGAQKPYWTSWSFGNDWQEAENWRLQICQAAGLETSQQR